MNTTVSKSFGLALLLAVGIIAVMVAMGAFTSQKAGAQVAGTVSIDPPDPAPGAAGTFTVSFRASPTGAVDDFGSITVELEGFGIPSSIDVRDIHIRKFGTGSNKSPASQSAGLADDISVSGNVITLDLNADPDAGTVGIANSEWIDIVIRERAGVTAPALAGSYDVDVGDETAVDAVTVMASLSTDPKKGGSGTEITVTGKAFADGTGTLSSAPYGGGESSSLKDVTVNDGAFETTVAAKDLNKAPDDGMSVITFADSNGDTDTAIFTVKGTTTLGSDSVGKGKLLEIKISDWIQNAPTLVKIDGVDLPIANDKGVADLNQAVPDPTDKDATFYVKISEQVGLGTKTVVLFDSGGARLDSASVEITAVDLTVSPSTALVGREVTVTGSGFTDDVREIKVGKATICDTVDNCNIEVASGGRVVAAFDIPNDEALKDAGDYTIAITDTGGRIGNGSVTIPEPTLTVDPAESRIGSTINLSGTGWPTGTGANLVGLYYDGDQYASAITDSSGGWSASIAVPHDVGVGSTHDVEAKATVGDRDVADNVNNVTQKAEHSTPDAVVTLSSAQAQRGTTVTVSGENFNVFETVKIEIGDSDVTPSATTTNGIGSFSTEVLVPGLSLGNKNLKVTVSDVPVVEFLEVVATPVVTTKTVEDVFGALIDNGSLTTVWRYDFDTRSWTSYTTDPETSFGNDLFEVEGGDILYIHVTSEQAFSHQKGETIPEGWSLITLN